mgnify:CR=1 FL=1
MTTPPSTHDPDAGSAHPAQTWAEDALAQGTTPILDFLEAAGVAGHREAEAMGALLALRRAGLVSFDGRVIQRPPRPGKSRARSPLSPDAGWFRHAVH